MKDGKYVFWNEPFGEAEGRTLNQVVRVLKEDVIAWQMARPDLKAKGFAYTNPQDALDDFLIVHWGWLGDSFDGE